MGSVYRRGQKLWIVFRDSEGKRHHRSSGLAVGREKQARALLDEVERQVAQGATYEVLSPAEVTVKAYAMGWLKRRAERVKTSQDETTRITKHALPRLGDLRMMEVRPRHIRDLILELRDGGNLAPRSIRHVYGSLHTMFRDAVVDELIDGNPCVLSKGVLPKSEDSDPEWRSGAIFSRSELEQLLSDERLLADRRVLYGLKGLAGLRHGEAAGLRWRHYDAAAEPLGRLTVANSYTRAGTKTGRTREVPVHPVLAHLLAEWKLGGWPLTYGRKPRPDDLIVPTRRMGVRRSPEAQKAFLLDLEKLGFRPRRGHDLRRTMISLARTDGARGDILEHCTHGPRGDIVNLYTTLPWHALCAEVSKLRVALRGGAVVTMKATGGDPQPSGITGAPDEAVTIAVTVGRELPDSARNPGAYGATPAGFEPASPA